MSLTGNVNIRLFLLAFLKALFLALKYEKKWLLPYRVIREIEMSVKDYFAQKNSKEIHRA